MQKINTELIPVIHVLDDIQVMTNVKTCSSNGIKKVFLINHGHMKYDELIKLSRRVNVNFPDMWIGLNMLDLTAREAVSLSLYHVNGLWCDATITPTDRAYFRKFHGMFFGGLAFKYQTQPTDLKEACDNAKQSTDVATTSGPATGKQPNINKIITMREMLGTHPLAIASGVSVDNVLDYAGIVDYLLVASSITDNAEMIIEDKLIALKNKLESDGK